MSTQCAWLRDLDLGSEINLAQAHKSKQLAGHKHPVLGMTNKHSKNPRKQLELLSKQTNDLGGFFR